MNPLIETANHLGERFLHFAWPMFWQSSLLIAVLFGIDFALSRKLRAAVRYAMWLILFVKLLLPPTLALPTSIAWWTNRPAPVKSEPRKTVVVTYDQTMPAEVPLEMPVLTQIAPPPPVLSPAGWFTVGSSMTMMLLLVWLALSWRQIARTIRTAADGSTEMEATLLDVKHSLNLRQKVRLRMTRDAMSPAVCGLFCPTILMPKVLAERLSPEQLRAVLLHELVHLRRGDVWVNCAQTLVQIAYWWHPLLWLANARIRRVREEAVDDAVMLTLRDGAETYAPTLLEVAKVAIARPLAGLRMVGILESRGALRQRIERLVNFRAPRHAGLTLVSVFGILAFTALAVPMGEGPARTAEQPSVSQAGTNSWPDPHFSGYEDIDLQPRFLIVDEARLRATLPGLTPGTPFGIPLDRLVNLQRRLSEAGAVAYSSAEPVRFQVFSGGHFHVQIGGCTNGVVNFIIQEIAAETTRVLGANVQFPATQPGWSQMDFFWTPWKEEGTVRSEMKLALDGNTNVTQVAETTIPLNGAMVWMVKFASSPGKCQLVLLQPASADKIVSTTLIINETQSPGAQPAETERQLDEAHDQLQVLAVKLGMPHDMAEAAMQIDAPMLGKMFQSESLQKYLPFAEKKRELDALQQDQKISEMKMLSTRTNRQVVSSGPSIPEAQTIRMLEADRDYQLPEYIRAKAYFDAISARYHISEPVDFSKITEENFNNYAEYFTARLAYERRVAFGRLLDNKIESLKGQTNQLSTTLSLYKTSLVHDSNGLVNSFYAPQTEAEKSFEVRWFKVDPFIVAKNLNIQWERGSMNASTVILAALREEFGKAGVDLQKPKSMFYNDRTGVLLFRTSADDLDIIENVLQRVTYTLPLVEIKTIFISVPDDFAKSLLKDIFTASNNAPTDGFYAVLFPGHAKQFRERCDQTPGVNIFGGPEVTTASGRQAQIMVDVEAMTLVKGIKPEALVPPGITNEMFYQTESLYTGPTVDFLPLVSADEYTIQLSAIPKVTEFFGYVGGKTNTAKYHVYVNGKKESVTLANPRPHIRTRTMAANATLLDGQTLLLGGAAWVESTTKADGTVETKTTKDSSNKQLFVLITPVLTDPAGNRVHTGEEMREFSDAKRESP